MTGVRKMVVGELTRFSPADAGEARHRDDIVALITGGGLPFSRQSFAPGHITAGCFIVDLETRCLLLHHHKRLNRWLQMGGHVDDGETPLQAALREGFEESGLSDLELLSNGIADLDVHPIPAAKGEPGHSHFDIRYIVRTRSPEAIKISISESNDLAWFDLERAAEAMNESSASRIIRKIGTLLK